MGSLDGILALATDVLRRCEQAGLATAVMLMEDVVLVLEEGDEIDDA